MTLDDIIDILLGGKYEDVLAIPELVNGKTLSYSFSPDFKNYTIKYCGTVTRGYGDYADATCAKLFGLSHEF